MGKRGGSNATISDKVGAAILTEYSTQTPRPTFVSLAKKHGVHPKAVQRYIDRNLSLVSVVSESDIKAELIVGAIPGAIEDVKALTRDLPISKMCKVMSSAEKQYEKHKDSDPHLAGGYLDQMRKCAIEMAKWLGIDKGLGVQDNTVRFEVEWRKGT